MEELLAFLSHWISEYGLIILGLGVFFEGETVLVTAGVMASHQKLVLWQVLLVGWAGALVGHLFWFSLARYLGQHWFVGRFPRLKDGLAKADGVVRRHPWSAVVLLQYMYGMRMIGALALGFSTLPYLWFAFAEAVNCLVWVFLVAGGGYVLGHEAHKLVEYSSKGALVAALLAVVGVLALRRFQDRK
jgi:membrane protein DedA with SNARE-associated domain